MNEPAPAAPRILVADDTPENLELLESYLRGQGYHVFALPNGDMALRAATRDLPDLILLDILMPGLDGYQVCERLKANPATREIPVVFLSALDELGDKVRAFEVGGVDYLTKPLRMEEVRARVRTHLELSRQKRELQATCDRLQDLERLRDNLTHMIVHDLRSPITVVDLNLELIGDLLATTDPTVTEALSMARSHVRRLSEMITQLLDLGRLESGQMPVDPTPGELVALARSVQLSLVCLAGVRNFRLTGSAAVHAFYDSPLVARVLANLLINAFKFTPERAEVTVDLRDEGAFARVTVADRGPGIPAEFHGRIFEKFGQVESRKGPRGFGIGLAFCRLAVEAQGGAIGVHSEVGGGSSFWFTLPTSPRPIADPHR